jgi:hypothetical protein
MSYEAQHNAIRNRLNAQWTTTPIAWDNVEFDRPDNSAYIQLVIQDSGTKQASMGAPDSNWFRSNGLLIIMIFVPLNQGDKVALEMADVLTAIFRRWVDAPTRLRFGAPFIRNIGAEPKFYHVNVLCPFQRDELF